MARVTVFSDARRRREWSDEERLEILREAFAPGAVVARVARRYDVSRGLIYIWRREAMRRAQSAFAPAVIEDAAALEPACGPAAEPEAAIVLELADGGRLRISASAPPALAAAALRAVR
ncbi:transposase [Blastomonas sp. CCH11-A4]|jgi:transposase|uniref:IS66-like element accessory protein TnpA n=1 Tax=Blastomonas sp. CCH11-A4 TaxID=1768782 RepID=UPI000824EF15|nr:transposase [Blastomonas sp. CCH11-A4]